MNIINNTQLIDVIHTPGSINPEPRHDNEPRVMDCVGEAGLTIPNSPFSFERLLSGEDWSRWDNFPTVQSGYRDQTAELNANGTYAETMTANDPVVMSGAPSPEMVDGGRTVEFLDSLVGANPTLGLPELPRPEELLMFEQWLYASSGEAHEASQANLSSNIDAVTYEELLALAERVGDVCCGIDAETIDENVNRRKYEECDAEDEKCVICLDELRHGEEVSRLRCGHEFHFVCIKRWLTAKNLCPLCKKRVLLCQFH